VAGVYLIFRNQLFRDAVAAILAAHPEIKLLGVTNRPERAASEITALAPSVILLEDTEDGPSIHDVHRILTSSIPCRLITLRLDQDGMHVWSQTWRQTVGPEDLVEAIVTAREDKS
jgi:DNA-binding NarL/FixJ family response regulator